MPNRRSLIVGLGGLAAGGGLVLGTGAFSTVEAQRTVSVETAGDADAFLALESAREDGEYVTEEDGVIGINLIGNDQGAAGLTRQAITTFRNLVTVTNQGSQSIESLSLSFADSTEINIGETFSFPVNEPDSEETATVGNGENVLGPAVDATPESLQPGEAVVFGITVDLVDGGTDDGDLPEDSEFNLTIRAETDPTN